MGKKSYGFTLIELTLVIVLLGILAAIAVPRFAGLGSLAEASVCRTNRQMVVRMYIDHLIENNVDHTDVLFSLFLDNSFEVVCPVGGLIRYEDGEVKCSVHTDISEDEEPGEEVPWL